MKANSSPNVVPLCDILLVLLIIFMVITPMSQSGMDIRLPEQSGGKSEGTIVLSIGENGKIYLNKDESYEDLQLLEKRLRSIFETRAHKTVFVKSSHQLPYANVIKVLDKVKGAGIDTICMMSQDTGTEVKLR